MHGGSTAWKTEDGHRIHGVERNGADARQTQIEGMDVRHEARGPWTRGKRKRQQPKEVGRVERDEEAWRPKVEIRTGQII